MFQPKPKFFAISKNIVKILLPAIKGVNEFISEFFATEFRGTKKSATVASVSKCVGKTGIYNLTIFVNDFAYLRYGTVHRILFSII